MSVGLASLGGQKQSWGDPHSCPLLCSPGQFISELCICILYRMAGGPCCPTWPLTEGLAAALEVFDEMDRLRATRCRIV